MTIGDPEPNFSLMVAHALVDGGADILELGIPSRIPKYDGPVIRSSYRRALRFGMNSDEAMQVVKEIDHPKIILSYYDSIKPDLDTFAKRSREVGAFSVLIPDLLIDHLELLDKFLQVSKKNDLDPVFFIHSTFPEWLIRKIASLNPAFIYLGLMPTTGIWFPVDAISAICKVRNYVEDVPLAVGFAISRPQQAIRYVRAGADGIVVGSAFARHIASRDLANVRELARSLKEVLK